MLLPINEQKRTLNLLDRHRLLVLPCLFGAVRRVDAVDEVRRGHAGGEREVVPDDEAVPEGHDGEDADEAGEEEERHEPADLGLHDVAAAVPGAAVHGRGPAHRQDVGAETAGVGDVGAGDDEGLDHGVLLAREGELRHRNADLQLNLRPKTLAVPATLR